MGPRSEKFILHSVLNFRRVKHFRLCLLETQVQCIVAGFKQSPGPVAADGDLGEDCEGQVEDEAR